MAMSTTRAAGEFAELCNRLKGFIDGYRKQTKRPQFCINFEKLATVLAHK